MGRKLLIENISKTFDTGDSFLTVIDSMSVSFNPGDVYCITGPSGAGKSTLLNCIALLDRPTSGSIWFSGHDLVTKTDDYVTRWRKEQVGMMFQLPYLINELTVVENVSLAGRIAGQSKDEADSRAYALLDAVGLRSKAEDSPTNLSGGQQQRVALVRALVKQPNILIADEPSAHLDVETNSCIQQVIDTSVTSGDMMAIIATHDAVFYQNSKVKKIFL
jgi:ABC-type lipoprotein export system ATPase subunit